jgi:hypothetical protein
MKVSFIQQWAVRQVRTRRGGIKGLPLDFLDERVGAMHSKGHIVRGHR